MIIKFWRTFKPLVSNKGVESCRIALVDKKEEDKTEKYKTRDSNNETIFDNLYVTNALTKYFQNAITKLGITEYSDSLGKNITTLGDPVDIALEKFKDHLNAKVVKENVCTQSLFNFTQISVFEMTKELSSLNSKKEGAFENIPTKILRTSSNICNIGPKKYGIPDF